ncbi:tetratricopeptide repeat protein [Fibrella sp. WM1]|uniref:tetratricopeptide repeat-containing sensor histidine kinase n=1 Tax=Fibrella musci TaxID=3242485 RepID=UPI00351FF413
MRISLTILLLAVSCKVVLGQSGEVDSLRAALRKLPPVGTSAVSDSNRLRLLYNLSERDHTDKHASTYLQQSSALINRWRWTKAKPWQSLYEGQLLFRQNYIYQAIEKHLDALTNGEEQRLSPLFIATCHRRLGSDYFVLQEYSLALNHYKKTQYFYLRSKPPVPYIEQVAVRNNVGLCYLNLKKYNEAIQQFKSILADSHQANDSVALSWTYSNLGTAQRDAGQHKQSIDSFGKSIAFDTEGPESVAFTTSEQALAYLALGDSLKALQLSNKAKKLAASKSFFDSYIAKNAYQIERKNRLFKAALADLEYYDSLRLNDDKILKKRSIDSFRLAYENQKKERAIERQSVQQKALLITILVVVLFSGYFVLNQVKLRQKNRKIEEQKRIIEVTNTELMTLNQELEDRVDERTRQLQLAYDEIKTAMVQGQTLERKRMASELHDNLGSMLSGIRFQMQAIEPDALHPAERNVYGRVLEMLGEAYHEVRHISHNLLPAVLETHGLYAALSKLVADLNVNKRIQFTLLADSTPHFGQTTNVELYCILLELITNLLKHSTATRVVIAFSDCPNHTGIELHDNGLLYDFQANAAGKGLNSVLSRAERVGATIRHHPNEQGGNCVEICVPLAERYVYLGN